MSRTHVIVLASAVLLLLLVLELVRRRRLREEYSWLWLLTAFSYLLLAVWPGLYTWVARFIGAVNATMAFTFLGLFFLVCIAIQFSVQLSRLTTRSKDLAQQIAILDSELRRLIETLDDDNSSMSETVERLADQNRDLAQRVAAVDYELNNMLTASERERAIAQPLEKQEGA
jgi:hypothetical protein